MASVVLTPEDLAPFADIPDAKAEAMIADVLARARLLAPCLAGDGLSEDQAAAAKAILRDVVLRWNDVGSGGYQQETKTAGPFTHQTMIGAGRDAKARFRPADIRELQDICRDVSGGHDGAWSLDMGRRHTVSYMIELPTGEIVDLRLRPDLWLQYGWWPREAERGR